MDPTFLPGWPGSKKAKENPSKGNVTVSWQWREMGLNPRGCPSNSKILQEAAEDHLVNKTHLTERSCELPGVPKSTFLMVFSPDGTKVASTHGNHKIYVSELSTGRHVKTLSGHPRTPWCVAFHPSRTQLLGSGCLGGQVRVWDLNGGSEVWMVNSKTVIASIAFHPRERLLVIATYNELYFWDWSQPQPFTKVQTINIKEKVRFVSFDTLGHKLITGISICSTPGLQGSSAQQTTSSTNESTSHLPGFLLNHSLDRNVPSYFSQLVHRYNNLLRNYRHLFITQQSQLNTIDRGTDPMDTEPGQNNVPLYRVTMETVQDSNPSVSAPSISHTVHSVLERRGNTSTDQDTEWSNRDTSNSLNLDVQSMSLGNTSTVQQTTTRSESGSYNTMTFVTTTPPRVSSAVSGRESSQSNVHWTAFRPVFEFDVSSTPRVRTPPPPSFMDTSASYALMATRPVERDDVRNELTASLNRLQGYMENSIDETLNIIELHDLVRAFPISSSSNRENSNNRVRNRLFTDTNVRYSQMNENVSSNPNNSNISQAEENNVPIDNVSQNLNDMTFEQHLRNIIYRDSSQTFTNLVTESPEFNTIRQILQYFHRQSSRRGNDVTGRSRSPTRNGLMSSDDGSDSDREMFSPLPVHVYRSRQWSNPSARTLGNSTIDSISTELTSTSTIARHIDHEYIRSSDQSADLDMVRLNNIPAPSRPESPTYPTNMLPSSSPAGSANNTESATSEIGVSQLLSMPSTSRNLPGTSTSRTEQSSNENQENRAFNKVTRGVQAIKKHTAALINLCSTRPPFPLRQLRRMWEDLRREVVTIQRQPPNPGFPSYFSLSARVRCNLLNSLNSGNQPSTSNQSSRNVNSPTEISSCNNDNTQTPTTAPSTSNSSSTETRRDSNTRLQNRRTYPPSSRLQTRLRYSHRDSASRTRRSYLFNSLNRTNHMSSSSRRCSRTRVSHSREHELTRVYIRYHARRVLTVMFSIMMDCLEADQLGDQLISMLRSLKKALGLTCLLLISQSFNREPQANTTNNTEQTNQPSTSSTTGRETFTSNNNEARSRIAIQISAVNRNHSVCARKRREAYYVLKREEALLNRNSSARMQPYRREINVVRETLNTSATSTCSTIQQATGIDVSLPSTSGVQNVTRVNVPTSSVNSVRTTEPSPQPSTSRSTGSHPQPTDSARYRGLFRRFLNSNYGFVRDINAYRRAENRRNLARTNDPPPHRRIISMAARPSDFYHVDGNGNGAIIDSFINNVVVPLVRVNDVPVSEMQNGESNPPTSRHAHVRLGDPPSMQSNMGPGEEGGGANIFSAGPNLIIETPESPVHRIQVWDFTQGQLPEIGNPNMNVVVHKCKIHNDASIDISKDGKLLVALLPAQRMRNLTHRLGIYSLDWNCLGECLYTALLEQNVVSISLSPCARHLAVGLGSRRMSLQPYGRNGIMALIYRLGGLNKNDDNSRHGCLLPIRSLEQSWELGFTSLNCLRWAPQPGQGLVYANNTGHLKILS